MVAAEILRLPRLLDVTREFAHEELPRRLQPAIEINRRDQRLTGVGQQRVLEAAAGFLLATAENHVVAQAHQLRHLGQRRGRDQVRLDLRLLPFGVGRERAKQRVRHHQAEHGIAQKLQRLVVADAAARVFVRLRPVGQRMLEQPAITEAIADARLERRERLRQRHHDAGPQVLAMTLDDPHRVRRLVGAHRDLGFAERVEREQKQARRRTGRAERLDAMAVEETLDHVRLDVGLGAKDDGEAAVGHTGVSILIRIMVMSSCWSAPPANARSSARMYERS